MEANLFAGALVCYLLATVSGIINMPFEKKVYRTGGLALTVLGFLLHTAALIVRTKTAGHAPFANLYESMVFFSWTIIAIYFFLDYKYKMKILGALVPPLAFLAIAYASMLPDTYKAAEPLVPALQSRWLEVHVITCFIAYAAFAVAFVTGIVYLVKLRNSAENLDVFDEISYKTIALGFPFLTLGIVTGAIWANYAWGTYWSWDPKETWALITWFVYAAYLHARVTKGWRGKKANILNIVGFAAVLFTYLGVNLLLSGLHSYAK